MFPRRHDLPTAPWRRPYNSQLLAGTSDLAGGGLVLFRGSGSSGVSEKSPPKIVHLFPQAFLNVLASFSVFFRSHRLAQALGPHKTIYPRFQLVISYPTR